VSGLALRLVFPAVVAAWQLVLLLAELPVPM
jgi:hypothetical protein